MERSYAQTNLQLYEQLRAREASDTELRLVGAAYDLAAQLLGARFRSSGKPLLAHLIGTASILARHGAGAEVVAAGLLHGAYDQGDFGTGRFGGTETKRAEVKRIAGTGVEELLHTYSTLDWRTRPPDLAPENERARDALFVRAANELEDVLDGNLAYSGPQKRESVLGGLDHARRIAETIGEEALASELAAAVEEAKSVTPSVLESRREGSYTLAPRSYRPRRRLRLLRKLRRLRRSLGGR